MVRISSLCLLLCCLASRFCIGAEEGIELYTQASKAFNDKFYERAEQQFGEFVAKYSAATNVASAILLQAQARFFQRRYDGAVELLTQNSTKAGALADQFAFWTGEALSEMENYVRAAERYGKVLSDFPQSPLRLRSSYLQAFCAFQLKDYPRTIELLRAPEGAFQKLSKDAGQDPIAFRGRLLLGETLMASSKAEEARTALTNVVLPADQPELNWEKHQLLARLTLAGTNAETALPSITNALAAAQSAKKPLLEAQSLNLEAEVYRKLNRFTNAVSSYERIGSIEALPVEQKRLALLKSIELLSSIGNTTNALVRLEAYLGTRTNEPASDLLKIKAGELWIQRSREIAAQSSAQAAAATNALALGRAHLATVITQFTNSPHLGRAWLNLGWIYWEEGSAFDLPARIQESERAFRHAAEKLTRSDNQALAVFKIADAQFYLKQPQLARSNYLGVVRNYTDLPQVRNALFDKAYRQLVRTSLELKDFSSAQKFLGEFRTAFPNNPLTEETMFVYGQSLAGEGRASQARTVFQDFLRNYPGSSLAAEVRFAEGRSHALEGDSDTALKSYQEWLNTFTNHVLRPQVEFRRAALMDRAGQRTNALVSFTNFVAQFPTSPLAPAAQTWVADYYFEQEQWRAAEQNYQRVFQNTNWLASPRAYEAKLMAAKTAFKRQGYNDAKSYLTNLVNDPRCPADLLPQVWFVLGDVFLEEPIVGSTNALNNFIEAAKVFDRVATQYPSNKLAVLAWGKKGDCHLQLASSPSYEQSYGEATNAYLMVLNSKLPNIPVSARNQAEVGLGLVFKNIAEGKPPAEREALLRAARERFLNVVYGGKENGERPDPYYLKLAGLEAGRLAESMGNPDAALQLYRRLLSEAPSLRTMWEARINSLQQRLAALGP